MTSIVNRVFEVSWDGIPDWDGEALYDSFAEATVNAVLDFEVYLENNFEDPGVSSWYPVGPFYWHHCDDASPTGIVIHQRPVYGSVSTC